MIELYVRVETIINNWAVPTLGGKQATWEATQRMDITEIKKNKKNAFANINAEGRAGVRVAVEEKISGPSGTYSSVSVRIEIAARCDQDEASITHCRDVLAQEAMKALDWYAGPAVQLLGEHVQKAPR